VSEPKRLRDQPATPLARALYDSVDLDRPKAGARGRALAAIGVGVAAGAAASTAAKAGAATAAAASAANAGGTSIAPVAAKMSTAALLKWLGVIAFGGAVSVAAVRVTTTYGSASAPAPTSEATAAAVEATTPAPVRGGAKDHVDEPAPSVEAPPAEAPIPSSVASANPSPRSSAAPRPTPLKLQTEALDKARAELTQGDPKKALATLDELDRRPAPGLLQEEATLLRIEGLFAAGDRARGEALARRFLREHPNSAYAQRVASRLKQAPSP
jgi:hypothetical protein